MNPSLPGAPQLSPTALDSLLPGIFKRASCPGCVRLFMSRRCLQLKDSVVKADQRLQSLEAPYAECQVQRKQSLSTRIIQHQYGFLFTTCVLAKKMPWSMGPDFSFDMNVGE